MTYMSNLKEESTQKQRFFNKNKNINANKNEKNQNNKVKSYNDNKIHTTMSFKESGAGKLTVVALSGTEEIGMNMTVYTYEENGEKFSIMVDCGVAFENLPGASVSMPNLNVLDEMGIKISAIIITHGHEDHIGAIPYLLDKLQAPIYASPFSSELIKRKLEYIRKKNYKIEIVGKGDVRDLGPFKIKWIHATHSIPDNSMLAIDASGIRVLHTGDWKDDPDPLLGMTTDFESIKKFGDKGVHALISDSTNIHQSNPAVSEQQVADSLKNLVMSAKEGRFVLTCFSSNVARIKGCFEAAKAAGRKVLVLGSSLKKAVEVSYELGYLSNELLVSDEEANRIQPKHLMIISTGSQGEENSALWKMANEMRTAGSVLEKNDTLVFSARVIDGRQHSVRKIINQLVERGVRIIHPWNSNTHIHASGHPSLPDVNKLIDTVRPNYVVPVHCEAEHRVSHIAFAKSKGYKAFNLRNGVIIEIGKEEIIACDRFKTSKVVLDGTRLISENSDVFQKRRELNESGMISIAIASKNKKLISNLYNIGVFDDDVDVNAKSTLTKQLKYEIDRLLIANMQDFIKNVPVARKKLVSLVKRFIWNAIRKDPLVNIQVLI